MAQEELFMVLDDTANSGKEPLPFKDEQEKRDYDRMLAKYKKMFNI